MKYLFLILLVFLAGMILAWRHERRLRQKHEQAVRALDKENERVREALNAMEGYYKKRDSLGREREQKTQAIKEAEDEESLLGIADSIAHDFNSGV